MDDHVHYLRLFMWMEGGLLLFVVDEEELLFVEEEEPWEDKAEGATDCDCCVGCNSSSTRIGK